MTEQGSTNQIKTMVPSEMWCKEECELTGVIATTFTHFDEGILKYYLRRASFKYEKYTKNIFLFECNPDFNKNRGDLIFNRLMRPSKQICERGCDKCIQGGNGKKPLKYFHPKLWLLRFAERIEEGKIDENKIFYRFIISSRNFAKESTQLVDGYVFVDTVINKKNNPSNCPLLNLVEKREYPTGSKEASYLKLIDELRYITMEQSDKENEFTLYWNKSLLPELKEADEIWLTSPFINGAFLEKLITAKKDMNVHVYTPFNEAGYLKYEIKDKKWAKQIDIHSIMQEEVDVNTEVLVSKWHAKQYILRLNDKYKFVTGSHNATLNAMTNNIELSAMYNISSDDKARIVGEWNEYFPNNCIKEIERPEPKASKMFDETSEDPKPEDLVNPDVLGNMLDNIEREDIRQEAIKDIEKNLIGKETEDLDRDLIILAENGISQEKINELKEAINEKETKYPRIKDDPVWKRYKKDIVLLAENLCKC